MTLAHLEVLLARNSLVLTNAIAAAPSLGAFQMAVARRGQPKETKPAGGRGLTAMRQRYLQRWRGLDGALCTRIGGSAVCFGAGEAAGLLRAYAPSAWTRVRACTFDNAIGGTFGQVPVVPMKDVSPTDTIIVGVRGFDQPRVAQRLRDRFSRVVTWYDLIDG
jgi:hypothetical protein